MVFEQSSTFIVPENVHSICAVAVGCAFGQGGGGLGWRNHIPVTPGEELVVQVGVYADAVKGATVLKRADGSVLMGAGHSTTNSGGLGGKNYLAENDGGDNGGAGGGSGSTAYGGGAGGYMGRGGNGGSSAGNAGAGGGGGGGKAAAGGGVGILGQGNNGVGASGSQVSILGGKGSVTAPATQMAYGAGGQKASTFGEQVSSGVIRIIWGDGRAFPTTKTGDL